MGMIDAINYLQKNELIAASVRNKPEKAPGYSHGLLFEVVERGLGILADLDEMSVGIAHGKTSPFFRNLLVICRCLEIGKRQLHDR